MSEINLDNPVEITKITRITKFIIEDVYVKPFTNCKISVSLIDENGIFNGKLFELSNEEYSNWGTNDNYIVDLIKQKISNLGS